MTICKIFKLVSRDTIVAEVVNETVSYIEVMNPLSVYNDFPDESFSDYELTGRKMGFLFQIRSTISNI